MKRHWCSMRSDQARVDAPQRASCRRPTRQNAGSRPRAAIACMTAATP